MILSIYFASLVINLVLIVFFTVNRGEDEYMNGTDFLMCILAILMPVFNTGVLLASALYVLLVCVDKFLGFIKGIWKPYLIRTLDYLNSKIIIPPKEPK